MHIFFFLFVGACLGREMPLDNKIVGGKVAYDGQFPYQVALRIDGKHHCGGSIIDETTILTAAHCLLDESLRSFPNIYVIAGTNSISKGGVRYEIKKRIVHEKYRNVVHNYDIALLKLSTKIKFSKKIQPIALETGVVPAGVNAIVSGWGITSTWPLITPEKLMYIRLKVTSDSECRQSTEGAAYNLLCASNYEGSACNGDSGGPLVVNKKLVGIVSYGKKYCPKSSTNQFTSVSAYVPWIMRNKM